jgi:hypothetical protein
MAPRFWPAHGPYDASSNWEAFKVSADCLESARADPELGSSALLWTHHRAIARKPSCARSDGDDESAERARVLSVRGIGNLAACRLSDSPKTGSIDDAVKFAVLTKIATEEPGRRDAHWSRGVDRGDRYRLRAMSLRRRRHEQANHLHGVPHRSDACVHLPIF